ncbi:hypothetical protein [Caballeronia sp. ATUFL_F2_KS42]|uniref:hypothetical protein n=1 Tax=Caballeronia sp. ATUFL_F2_KS42 TaxID=2921765 RepID=UPI002027966F|nr:hypothetical protein [Caballeronia sp. ATUFL_F2_KS42]
MCSRKVSNAFRKEVTAGAGRRDFDAARRFIEDKKHRRFVSHWDDEEIRIDVAPNASGVSDVKTVFDSKTVIDFSGGESIFKPQGLRKHPELLATLKALVNEDCHAHDAGDIEREVGRTVRSFLRLIVWLFRHARYKLSKVEPELVQTLATELANGGWWSALDYDARFELLLQRANVDLKFRNSLEGSGHIGEFSCNMDAISRHLMLPIASASLPKAIVQRIAEATGSQRPVQKDKDLPLVSPHSLYQNLKFLNRCALIGGFDSFGERPFKSAHRRAIELYKGEHPDLRTENLGITDVVTIFTEAMRWIHVCADGVIMVCETARNELESCDPSVLSLEVIGDRVTRKTVALHEQIADSYGLPKALRALARNQESSLRHLILKLQFSCAIAVLFNHGRRREEVLGTGKTYGLYRGCLTPANDGRDGSYLDVYIEKTLQRYASMWANEIVERAVDVMERLGQTFRPLGTEPLAVAPTLDEARKEKLFVWRHFSYAAFNDRPNVFSFQEGAKLFFSDLNVSITKVSASHIYRRCFALIYMYRHDHPVLMALSRHLCHFTLETTRIYTTDGRDVADDRSIESLFAAIEKEDADFSDEFEDIRSTYFQEKVVNILRGVNRMTFAGVASI